MMKKTMKIGFAGRLVTWDGRFQVNWGLTGSSFNRNTKKFNSYNAARKYVGLLRRKFSQKYKIDYTYMAD